MSEVHVFDTFAVGSRGRILHFDVVIEARDPGRALASARAWLQSIGEPEATVKSESCCLCHSAGEVPESVRRDIARQGYAIIRLEGCPR